MIVCRQCLQAIESHEGHQTQRKLSPLEDGELIKDGYGDDDGSMCIVSGAKNMYRLTKHMKFNGG